MLNTISGKRARSRDPAEVLRSTLQARTSSSHKSIVSKQAPQTLLYSAALPQLLDSTLAAGSQQRLRGCLAPFIAACGHYGLRIRRCDSSDVLIMYDTRLDVGDCPIFVLCSALPHDMSTTCYCCADIIIYSIFPETERLGGGSERLGLFG